MGRGERSLAARRRGVGKGALGALAALGTWLAGCVTPRAALGQAGEAVATAVGEVATGVGPMVGAPGAPPPAPQAIPTEAPNYTAPPQTRAFWVDAFHDGIKTPAQVDALIKAAQTAGANMLVVQVRRRGDAYYTRTTEPRVEDPRLARGFDALQATIEKARAVSPPLEVHAWIATVALWRDRDRPPRDPAHAFNTHGPHAPEEENWISLDDTGRAWDNENYMLDPGNPAAARYVATVAEELARNYDVDGIHLDLVRYAGVQWGYNPASVARYRRRHGLADTARPPAPGETRWQQWRRDQVTALVRRIYLDCVAVKPRLKMTAAVIGWGNGPVDDASWRRTSAYGNVFQEWKRWLEEGIVDALLPMNYDDEANPEQRAWFDRWVAWEKGLLELPKKRHVVVGVGLFLNKVEAGLAQVRRALAAVNGVALYSYAVTNAPPRGSDDPEVPNEAFYERLSAPDGPFVGVAPAPAMPWKEPGFPAAHVRGVATAGGAPLDGATVRLDGPARALAEADGNGYFGAVELPPGTYAVTVMHGGAAAWRGSVELPAGAVTTLDVSV